MTWRVSPEDWLHDFTSVPRGRARIHESRDPVDDRLRALLHGDDVCVPDQDFLSVKRY